MTIKGSLGKQDIKLTDIEIYLTLEQAKDFLGHLQSFKEQQEVAPLKENEAIIDGEIINDVLVKNSIELYHRK